MAGAPATVRVVVDGCGWWANEHHLPTLVASPAVEVVAVVDPDTSRRDDARRRFAVVDGFAELADALDALAPDAVVIATPHDVHAAHSALALRRGCHVLCEKPLALDPADSAELVELATSQRRALVVPHAWNRHPLTLAAADLVGTVGKLDVVELVMTGAVEGLLRGDPSSVAATGVAPQPSTWADYDRGGGFVFGQLSHALGLLFALVDADVSQVFAPPPPSRTRLPAELHVGATIVLGGGAVVSLVGAVSPARRDRRLNVSLFGDDGVLDLDLERGRERLRATGMDGRQEVVVAPVDGAARQRAVTEHFLEAVRAGNPLPKEIRLAHRVVVACAALRESQRTGGIVEVDS